MTIWIEVTPVKAKSVAAEHGSGYATVAPTPGNKRLIALNRILSMDTQPIVDESVLQQVTIIGTTIKVHGQTESMDVYEPKEEIARITRAIDIVVGYRPPTDVILKPDFTRIKWNVAACSVFNIDYGHAEAAMAKYVKERGAVRIDGSIADGIGIRLPIAECVEDTRVRFAHDDPLRQAYFKDLSDELGALSQT